MPIRNLDPNELGLNEDWEGNNAALSCPICNKVFIVSDTRMHVGPDDTKGYRECPGCGKSIGRVTGAESPAAPPALSGKIIQIRKLPAPA
jgi:hypothetical protein